MELQFFPTDISYETNINGKAAIQLFGRSLNGEKVCVIDPNFEPYFYVIPNDNTLIANLIDYISKIIYVDDKSRYYVTKTELVRKKILRKDIDAIKEIVNHPSAVPEIKREIKTLSSVKEIREADLLFVRRYLIDK